MRAGAGGARAGSGGGKGVRSQSDPPTPGEWRRKGSATGCAGDANAADSGTARRSAGQHSPAFPRVLVAPATHRYARAHEAAERATGERRAGPGDGPRGGTRPVPGMAPGRGPRPWRGGGRGVILRIDRAWLLDIAHQFVPGDPDVTDYGTLAAAVARHADEVMGVPVYEAVNQRAAALMHQLIRVPAPGVRQRALRCRRGRLLPQRLRCHRHRRAPTGRRPRRPYPRRARRRAGGRGSHPHLVPLTALRTPAPAPALAPLRTATGSASGTFQAVASACPRSDIASGITRRQKPSVCSPSGNRPTRARACRATWRAAGQNGSS